MESLITVVRTNDVVCNQHSDKIDSAIKTLNESRKNLAPRQTFQVTDYEVHQRSEYNRLRTAHEKLSAEESNLRDRHDLLDNLLHNAESLQIDLRKQLAELRKQVKQENAYHDVDDLYPPESEQSKNTAPAVDSQPTGKGLKELRAELTRIRSKLEGYRIPHCLLLIGRIEKGEFHAREIELQKRVTELEDELVVAHADASNIAACQKCKQSCNGRITRKELWAKVNAIKLRHALDVAIVEMKVKKQR
jgi:hypothetical protein